MKIKKGDKIKVMAGKDKGREGTVKEVLPKEGKIVADGINLFKKHARPKGEGKRGGIIDIIKPIFVANVALVCPKCGKATRVGYQIDKSGGKTRVCKKCREAI